VFERPVVGTFGILRKAAGGKFLLFQVIIQTIAADPFAGAWLIGTVARLKVANLIALHL
jgi:hypothetical protein